MTTVGVLMAGIDSRIVIVGLPQVAASIPSKLRGRRARANPSAPAQSPPA
ncbi:MAG TPA: hypothetical protein VI915_05180 [Thermoplasmata archaeon]|nr:hypothetical protein [Thermoplasmata archaeon]